MKVVRLASAADVAAADAYLRLADPLLFDAKPPPEMTAPCRAAMPSASTGR